MMNMKTNEYGILDNGQSRDVIHNGKCYTIKRGEPDEWGADYYKQQIKDNGTRQIRYDGAIYMTWGVWIYPDGSTIDEKPWT
jgi:hypothetical protein